MSVTHSVCWTVNISTASGENTDRSKKTLMPANILEKEDILVIVFFLESVGPLSTLCPTPASAFLGQKQHKPFFYFYFFPEIAGVQGWSPPDSAIVLTGK